MDVQDNMATCVPIVFQDVDSGYNRVYPYVRMHEVTKTYVLALNNTIKKLEEMFGPISKFRTKTNIGRTVATTTGVASTSLAVTGVILAPVTFGTSLGLTFGGIAGGIAAGATTAGVAYIDYRETKDFVCEMNLIIKELEDSSKALDDMLKVFRSIVIEMVKLGYTEHDAIARTFIGVAKGFVDVGRISQNAGSVALAVANMPIGRMTLDTTSNYIKTSGLAGGQFLTKVATKEAASFSMPAAGAASAGGNVLQSTSNILIGLTVGFGVAFTVMDIALLVHAWSMKHPAAKAIEEKINKIKDEINKWENFSMDIYKCATDYKIFQLHRIVENNDKKHAQRESEMKQDFEKCKKQIKQEAEEKERTIEAKYVERERQMKKEFEGEVRRIEDKYEERERRDKVKQNEMEEKLSKIEAFISKYDNKI